MANINKIRLSGQTYNIEDANASKTVELTQAQYDALTVKDPNTFYVITDAQGADLSNYYTKSETSGATEISTALNAKQDTLVSGTNIKTINNESLLGSGNIDIQGGGGKAIEAGRGISITTGETADTVSFNLPISAGTGSDSIIVGYSGNTATKSYSIALGSFNKASGDSSMAVNDYNVAGGNWAFAGGEGTKALGVASTSFGYNTNANKDYSFAVGRYNNANNVASFACGVSNISSSASTTFGHSGNTLFSVGNGGQGYYSNKRHNAFEIRENGDIYIADTNDTETTYEYEKPMIKLQDALGGGGSSYTAGDGIDITNDVISVTGKVDTTAFTAHTADTVIHVTSAEKTAWNNKSDFSGSYNDLTNKLSAGTNITIVDNVISAEGGGGKAVVGGRGITVTSGETADTINCTVPASASSGNYSIMFGQPASSGDASGSKTITGGQWSKAYAEGSVAIGQMNESRGSWAWAIGNGTSAVGQAAFACGEHNSTNNPAEFTCGYATITSGGSDTSIMTLFTVGNGKYQGGYQRHNALDIRMNGDIYIPDTNSTSTSNYWQKPMIKLQDTVSATAANTTALGGLKLVKLSQSEYDSLATKDNSTLYVIVN